MAFSQDLRDRAAPIWSASLDHPFVRGIGDGTLPVEKFRFYIRQDYVFLIEFSRVLALAAARATDLDVMSHYASLLATTLNGEMELHRGYCERFGIARDELEATAAAPTTHAYTRHLLHMAESGSLAEITASLIPCQAGYAEIGRELAVRGEPVSQPLYGEWIRMYASPEMQAIVAWACGLLDRLGADTGDAERERIAEVYLTSSRYEYMFWEMAYRMEQWPI
jgi:thiaminase (transcriptional activator TenA)